MNASAPDRFPRGLGNAWIFSVFNALSFQVVLSSPMILYAKSLGASATVLGLIDGMMPLLVIAQIPAAQFIGRVGHKRFLLAGWGTRVGFIFALAMVPLAGGFLDATTRLILVLALLFGFNLSRGISSCAWLPWISLIVPESLRGRYLAIDQAVMNLASAVCFVVSALTLAGNPGAGRFSALFVFSALMGATSLVFMKRIPDVPAPAEHQSNSGQAVPWLAMIRHAPFARLLAAVAAWSVASGGLAAFTVDFLRTQPGMVESRILLVTSVSYVGGLCSLWFLGPRLDGLGSKPVLGFSLVLWLGIILGWLLLAGGLLNPAIGTVLVLQFLRGLFNALVTMAFTRLAMAIVPAMGRNHFFALYSVIGSVILGLAPVGWGLLIDAVGTRRTTWLGLDWNQHSVFFAGVLAAMGLTLALVRRLQETNAAGMDRLLREVLVDSPQRVLARLWTRDSAE